MANHDHEQTLALFEDELDDSMLEYMDDPEILAKWPQGLTDMLSILEAAFVRDGAVVADARRLAFRAVRALAGFAGGRSLYVPKGEQLETALRDREIWERHNGANVSELAKVYHLTEVQIYSILARQRKMIRARLQPGLFGD